MDEILQRFTENLFARLDGPLHFRFIAQPLMAVILAIIGGANDAKLGRPAYLWAVVFNPGHRKDLLRDGWKQVSRIFVLALILDTFYQLYVHHMVYPGEALVVGFLLAVVPYVLVRGPVNRILRLLKRKAPRASTVSAS
ncbi:MAG TPA: hypothetical protein VLT16_09430 [Candidatus Limnocylindrales bacterium]|nr:hypothetical protein [Candidatus Limnocylindrales bacterium]